jgi:hypothetical protein
MLIGMLCEIGLAQESFELPSRLRKRFGEAYDAALATATPLDDQALAREILQYARKSWVQGEWRRQCAMTAYHLGMADPSGHRIAARAMWTLARDEPQYRIEATEHLLAVEQAALDRVDHSEQRYVGERVVQALLHCAVAAADQGRRALAAQRFEQAAALADRIQSPAMEQLEQSRASMNRRLDMAFRASELQGHLERHPEDVPAREELLRIYVTIMDSTPLAAKVLAPELDETWRSYIPATLRNPAELPPSVSKELGDWYLVLAEQAHPEDRPEMLRKARMYYRLYVLREQTEALRVPEVAERLAEIEQELRLHSRTSEQPDWALHAAALELPLTPPIRDAVRNAQTGLLAMQNPDGAWNGHPQAGAGTADPHYPTALALLAMSQSGYPSQDPPILLAMETLEREAPRSTMGLAFRCALWSAAQIEWGDRYDGFLRADVKRLLDSSLDGSFEARSTPGDPIRNGLPLVTMYAHWGLACAQRGGVPVSREFWLKGLGWWLRGKNRDGGWGEVIGQPTQHVTTLGGTAALLYCLQGMGKTREEAMGHTGALSAMRWIEQFYDNGQNTDPLHFLFALARLGAATGRTSFGNRDWYPWASGALLERQGPNGIWNPTTRPADTSTAMGILILQYATKPAGEAATKQPQAGPQP